MVFKNDLRTLWIGFAVGAATGIAIGLLYAPQPGENTREQIKETAEKAQEKLAQVTEKAKETISQLSHKGEEQEVKEQV